MSTDLARARAASVLDVLGDDFWAWWRTGVGAGLVALLLALVLGASFDSNAHPDIAGLVKLLTTAALATCMATVAHVAVKRLHRWRQIGSLRRLPVAQTAPRWDAIALLLAASLAWIVLATWACVSVVTADIDGRATAPWVVAVLVVTACSAAFGRWERSVWSQALATILMFYVYSSMGSVAQAVVGLSAAQVLIMAALSMLVLAWSLMPPPARVKGGASAAAWAWLDVAAWEQPLKAWYRARFEGMLRIVPVVALGAAALVAPFVAGQRSGTWFFTWISYQFMVVGFTAASWHAPEQHFRERLSPAFERKRVWLALRLWWGQCKWLIPTCIVFAVLTSPWALRWSQSTAIDVYQAVLPALPWLVANLALLVAASTLWVGLRRGRRILDLVFLPIWIAMLGAGTWGGRPLWDLEIAWSGRVDALGSMVAGTALLLVLACWVWNRGSLAGMERWGASRLDRTG